jgi:hypothetical protein
MKVMLYLSLFGLLVLSGGCMTSATLDSAHGSAQTNEKGEVVADAKSKPGYYALLPLTIPADIATFPFQLCYVWWSFEFGNGPYMRDSM